MRARTAIQARWRPDKRRSPHRSALSAAARPERARRRSALETALVTAPLVFHPGIDPDFSPCLACSSPRSRFQVPTHNTCRRRLSQRPAQTTQRQYRLISGPTPAAFPAGIANTSAMTARGAPSRRSSPMVRARSTWTSSHNHHRFAVASSTHGRSVGRADPRAGHPAPETKEEA